MRLQPRSIAAIALLIVQVAAIGGIAGFGALRARARRPAVESNRDLARALRLTSVSLWSEARYCRHPAEADRFAPFADHPAAIEHYPAGSMVPPPALHGSRR